MFLSDPGQVQSLSADTGDLLIRSTRVNLRVQRHGAGPAPHNIDPSEAPRPTTDPSAAPRPIRAPPPPGEEELQTIRLAAGGRGAGLEALRQRSQSAPHRRPVRVRLLDSHDVPGQDSNSHDAPGPSAVTAGAVDYSSHSAPGANYSCNMERVSELTESVQRLLHNYRGQALTEETLQRLETLHNQQLTLQNQLLDSALKMAVRPQAPPPAHLSSGVSTETRDTPTAAVPMETLPVAVAPPCCRERATDSLSRGDHTAAVDGLRANESTEEAWFRARQVLMELERLRSVLTQREEPEEPPQPKAEQPPPKETRPKSSRTFQNTARSHRVPSQSNLKAPRQQHHTRSQAKTSAGPPSKTSAGPPSKTSAGPPSKTSPNSLRKPQSSKLPAENLLESGGEEQDEALVQQSHENYIQYLQNRIKTKQNELEKHRNGAETLDKYRKEHEEAAVSQKMEQAGGIEEKHQEKENICSSLGLGQDPGPVLGSAGPQGLRRVLEGPEGPGSVLDEARLVLKKVQRQRKVLEENLESQLRARSGELLHCRLDALSQNRDCSDEIRIKETVDWFIRDFQAVTKRSNQESARTKVSANRTAADRRNPTPSANRSAADRRNPAPSGRGRRPTSRVPIVHVQDPPVDPVREREERLRHLYGKAAHEGQRRSLKRAPYLRLSSPVSPDRSRPRPRLVQSVRGVKLKSCKTQTPAPAPGLGPDPGPAVSPGSVRSSPGFPAVAVPLGRSRTGPSHRAPEEVTSPPRAKPSPPPQVMTSQSNPSPQAEDEGRAEEPVHQISDPPVVNILQSAPLLQEEEEAEFPGTHFLSVADLEQSEAGSEAAPGGSEEVLQLEGGPGPDSVQYQGPQFPPQPPAPSLPSAQGQSLDLGLSLQRDALEDRLVQWVEQQLMSRIITEMSRRPLSDPTHSPYAVQSQHRPEPAYPLSPVQSEPSAASDLDHRDSVLQLQVDSGLDLDPDQVRGLVVEVLTEIVALFLGSRESGISEDPETKPRPGPGPEPGAETEPTPQTPSETQEVLVPTPEATPPQTPPPAAAQTPPLSLVATPRATPPPPLSDRPIAEEEHLPPEPVATPPPTPLVTCPDDDTPLVQTQEARETPPPPKSSPAPAAVVPPPDASSSPSSASESSVSSSAANATAPRHISEGELLLSLRHLQATHEENCSFSSSLQELQDMELDPPSEGQVHSSSVMSFISNRQREPRPPPEGSWGRGLEEEEEVSAGEIKGFTVESGTNQSRSPGQASPITGEALGWTNQSALSEGLLTSDLLDSQLAQAHTPHSAPKQSPDLGLDRDQDPPQSLQDHDRSPQRNGVDRAEGGVWGEGGPALVKMEVFVPSVEAAETSGGSDSSDVF